MELRNGTTSSQHAWHVLRLCGGWRAVREGCFGCINCRKGRVPPGAESPAAGPAAARRHKRGCERNECSMTVSLQHPAATAAPGHATLIVPPRWSCLHATARRAHQPSPGPATQPPRGGACQVTRHSAAPGWEQLARATQHTHAHKRSSGVPVTLTGSAPSGWPD